MENLRAQTQANRYDQITPYGSQVWSQTDASNPDKWKSTVSLDPRAQTALDSQFAASNRMGALTGQAADRVDTSLAQPFDDSSVQKIADESYGAQTARLDPQWDQNEHAMDAKLSNQGITHGSEAYNNAQRAFGQQRNDAYQQARLASIATMPQTYQLATSTRNYPINELNALRTGTQIQNPTFGGSTPLAGYVPGKDASGAANGLYSGALNAYNADVGATNSQNSAAAGIGSAALSAAAYAGYF